MSRKFFGTDGIRGHVGEHPMTVDFALRLASAAARVLAPAGGAALIGKDTRVSGYMFESALEAGFVAAGVDAHLIGPLPTPGIAYMTRHLGCRFGVVISASHNPFGDNGIKFFDSEGGKLSDEQETAIEAELDAPPVTRDSRHLGRADRTDKLRGHYQDFCRRSVPDRMNFDGLKLVIDCANGAGYKVAPRTLMDMGAEVIPIGCSPNGRNINDGCGSTAPQLLQLTVPGVRAQMGIALDGDGDRVLLVDSLGRQVDGDQILYIIGCARQAAGELQGPVVGTLMSNYGLELALRERGIGFERAAVGDRYVLARMKETGSLLGGETSGHILCLDRTTTGDGLISALQVMAIMQQTGKSLAELTVGMQRFPQILINCKVARRFDPMKVPAIAAAAAAVGARLGGQGRVLLRASGTEPLVRVMVEGQDPALTRACADELAELVQNAKVA